MFSGHDTDSHHGRHYGNSVFFRKCPKLLLRLTEQYTASGTDNRPLCLFQFPDHLFDLYGMSLDRWFISAEVYLFRIMKILDRGILNINGNIDQHRSFSTGIGNIKRFPEYSGNIIYIFYQIAVFHKRFHSAGDVRLLEYIASQQFAVHLTGDTDQWNTVRKCCSNTRDNIRSARSGGYRTDSGSSGHSCHTAGSMCCILFGTDQYCLNIGIQNTVEKRTYRHSGISEYRTYTFFFQTFNNRICSNHVIPLLYLYSIIFRCLFYSIRLLASFTASAASLE